MKVLIVDDEPLIRRSLSRAFSIRGHDTVEAIDGEEGIEKWRSQSPELVVLDVLMPKLTGPQVLSRKAELPPAKVVLISAYTGDYDPKKAQDLGADLFISKPFPDVFAIVDRAENLVRSSSK